MNDDSTEKRMAGDYEIIQAVQIGDREVVLGENPQDETGMKYMCAFCRQNALFAEYSEVMASDDFPEIVELFGQRVAEQAQKTHIELNKPRIQGIDDRPITAEGCIPISYEDDLHGKIVVIKPEVLRREYRRATRQLKLCILEKKAAMSAWTCWERYSRRTFPVGPSMALLRFSRNRPKRKPQRSVSDDGLQRKRRIYHYGFLSCGRQRICLGCSFDSAPAVCHLEM